MLHVKENSLCYLIVNRQKYATAYRSHLQIEMSGRSSQKLRQGKRKILKRWKEMCESSRRKQTRQKLLRQDKSFQLCKRRKRRRVSRRLGLIASCEAYSQFICLCAVTKLNTKLFCFVLGFVFFLITAVVAPKDL